MYITERIVSVANTGEAVPRPSPDVASVGSQIPISGLTYQVITFSDWVAVLGSASCRIEGVVQFSGLF